MDPADAFNIRSVKLAEATRVRLLSLAAAARSRIQPSTAWLRMAECCTRGGCPMSRMQLQGQQRNRT